jgi:transposase, IS5 family
VRIDSTVKEALMHAPTDSSLLWDGVRVMVRLLKEAETLLGAAPFTWRNRRRLAKKRAAAIPYSRGKRRKAKLYRDLITATRATMASLRLAAQHLLASGSIEAVVWRGVVFGGDTLLTGAQYDSENCIGFGEKQAASLASTQV